MTEPTPVVVIDGVDFVPARWVLANSVTASRLVDALIAPFMGDNWTEDYPDSADECRVVVSDGPFDADDKSPTVAEFVTQLLGDGRDGGTQGGGPQ